MSSAASAVPAPKGMLWCGRILSLLVVLFLLFDGVTKVMRIAPVMQAFARLGYPKDLAVVIGTILLICTVIYIIPQTSILGAILLTGYLGGAFEVNLRAGSPAFEAAFPLIFAALTWLGLYLREPRLRPLIPLRLNRSSR
jgi:hypothetical protein